MENAPKRLVLEGGCHHQRFAFEEAVMFPCVKCRRVKIDTLDAIMLVFLSGPLMPVYFFGGNFFPVVSKGADHDDKVR